MTDNQGASSARRWKISDPVWYGVALSAIVAAEMIRWLLPPSSSGFARYAMTLPLLTFLGLTSYDRYRLGASWWRAVAIGLGTAILALGVGLLTGYLFPRAV